MLMRIITRLFAGMVPQLAVPHAHAGASGIVTPDEMPAVDEAIAAMAATTIEPPRPAGDPLARMWWALPGNVLEYGDSGFSIRLRTNPDQAPFAAYSPEGVLLATSFELGLLKEYCERQAGYRDQFDPQPAPAGGEER